MPAVPILIANAVVAELNDATRIWHLPAATFTAARRYVPVFDGDDAQTLQVSVVPLTIGDADQTQHSRGKTLKEYGIVIDVQKTVTAGDISEVDTLVNLMEAITDFFSDSHELATLTNYRVAEAANETVYEPNVLYTDHTFESVIALIVRGYRP